MNAITMISRDQRKTRKNKLLLQKQNKEWMKKKMNRYIKKENVEK